VSTHAKTIRFSGGGVVTLHISVDLLALHHDDRRARDRRHTYWFLAHELRLDSDAVALQGEGARARTGG
jgi:hypothetical protein